MSNNDNVKEYAAHTGNSAGSKPMVELPGRPKMVDGVSIQGRTEAEFICELFTELARSGAFYNYCGNIIQKTNYKRRDYKTGKEFYVDKFTHVKPPGFVVEVENYVDIGSYMVNGKKEKVFVKRSLTRRLSSKVLASTIARDLLPYIRDIAEIKEKSC